MEINIANLIKAIKKHSILYDSTSKDYYDRQKKKQIWEDICSMLKPDWDEWSDNEKMLFGKEVQKKWQSLRDCFRRELSAQKNPQPTSGKKKAKYKYFDALEFLTPFTNITASDTNTSGQELDVTFSELEVEIAPKDPLESEGRPLKRKRRSFEEERAVSGEGSQVENNLKRRRYLDDDEAFLMSLKPSFLQYSLDQKYLLRIELMKTILKFKQSQSCMNIKGEVDEGDSDYS